MRDLPNLRERLERIERDVYSIAEDRLASDEVSVAASLFMVAGELRQETEAFAQQPEPAATISFPQSEWDTMEMALGSGDLPGARRVFTELNRKRFQPGPAGEPREWYRTLVDAVNTPTKPIREDHECVRCGGSGGGTDPATSCSCCDGTGAEPQQPVERLEETVLRIVTAGNGASPEAITRRVLAALTQLGWREPEAQAERTVVYTIPPYSPEVDEVLELLRADTPTKGTARRAISLIGKFVRVYPPVEPPGFGNTPGEISFDPPEGGRL
jgi:hypothetical protein